MAFTPEDGTGLAAANSYVSEAELDAWVTDRNLTISIVQVEKEAAMIEATTYIDGKFGARFVGQRDTRTQGLDWPRQYAYDETGEYIEDGAVPREVKNATLELAVARLVQASVLLPNVVAGESGIILTEDKIGDLMTKVEYDGGSGSAGEPVYRTAARILRPLLNPVGIVRA